jgi:hypothetical protein
MLHGIGSKLRDGYGLGTSEVVTFRQLSAEAQTYRDAVEFSNGMRIRLQELDDDQRLDVLTLAPDSAGAPLDLLKGVFGPARP